MEAHRDGFTISGIASTTAHVNKGVSTGQRSNRTLVYEIHAQMLETDWPEFRKEFCGINGREDPGGSARACRRLRSPEETESIHKVSL
jgi:hypothetical protein